MCWQVCSSDLMEHVCLYSNVHYPSDIIPVNHWLLMYRGPACVSSWPHASLIPCLLSHASCAPPFSLLCDLFQTVYCLAAYMPQCAAMCGTLLLIMCHILVLFGLPAPQQHPLFFCLKPIASIVREVEWMTRRQKKKTAWLYSGIWNQARRCHHQMNSGMWPFICSLLFTLY